ncbi:MAG: hypothetical protein JXL80_10530 [Planctomycetes bacterium]|nr:hypothetical protein [Planctomycetota bacterium]
MNTKNQRYAEDPVAQADLAEWHARWGRDHTGCYRRQCSVCGKIFYAGMPHASLCSERCNQDIILARRREARRRQRTRSCLVCGQRFVARRRDGIYCSKACKQAAYRRRAKTAGRS